MKFCLTAQLVISDVDFDLEIEFFFFTRSGFIAFYIEINSKKLT